LVDQLVRRKLIRSAALREAFLAVPRETFIPAVMGEKGLDAVYKDEAYPAKVDESGRWLSSSSQPGIMAQMLEGLELKPGVRVLEIGTGTGYNAALLAHMLGSAGRVVTVDIDDDLARQARSALSTTGLKVEVVTADGLLGRAAAAPYDRIIVTATPPRLPIAWRDQLTEGGLLIVPLQGPGDWSLPLIWKLRRDEARLRVVDAYNGGFMPFRAADGDGPAEEQLPSISAGARTGVPTVWMTSPRFSSMKPLAIRRLLHSLTATARAERFNRHGMLSPSLALHLVFAMPGFSNGHVMFDGKWQRSGIVFFDPRTGGAAVATYRGWLLGFGMPEVEERVREVIAAWYDAGRPALLDLNAAFAWAPWPKGRTVDMGDGCRLVIPRRRSATLQRASVRVATSVVTQAE